jgi:hypothetical protein
MGTILYDYLNDSCFFDEKLITSNFSSLAENQLTGELQKYREFCLDNLDKIYAEIPKEKRNLSIFAGRTGLSIEELKRSALYVEQQIIDDPLFELTREQDANRQAVSASLGYSTRSLEREELSKAVLFMKKITPMVGTDYVKLLPISKIYEPPQEIGINYSENYFSDFLPKPVLEFFHARANVRSLRRAESNWIVEKHLTPCRGIFIEFQDHPGTDGFIYYLQDFHPLDFDEKSGRVKFEITLPEEPPDQKYFDAWVFQSINQSANSFYKNILSEYAISQECNSSFLTCSQFVFNLLQLLGLSESGIKSHTATSILELDLPLIDEIDLELLMRIRQDDGEAFQNFRDSLERGFMELRLENDPEALKLKTENLIHQLTEIQVREIERKVRSLKRIAGFEIALATLGLAGAVHTGGWSLLAAATAIFQGFKSFEAYRKEVKLNPSYFLWKLKKSNKV